MIMTSKSNILSDREMQILYMIAQEKSSKVISELLYISLATVESHRKNIMMKVCAKNTAGIIVRAFQYGILDIDQYGNLKLNSHKVGNGKQ